MIGKSWCLFLICAVAIKAQQYCIYGPDVFPWNPYVCPSFLANRTSAERDEYFTIANNCSVTIPMIKMGMVEWGRRLGEGTAVENYIRNVTLFVKSVANSVKNELGASKLQADMEWLITNDTMPISMRNAQIMYYVKSSDPAIVAVVNAWNKYGSAGPFRANNSGVFNQFGLPASDGYPSIPNNQANYGQSNINGQQAPWNIFNQQNQFNANGFTTTTPYPGEFGNNQFNPFNQQGYFNSNGFTSQQYAGQSNINQWNYNQRNQFCKYGDNIFPWFPYRCPYFLGNLTEAQRDGYFAIVNNKSLPLQNMTNSLLKWADPIGLAEKVVVYESFIDQFYSAIGRKLNLGSNLRTLEIFLILSNVNQTRADRESIIAMAMSSTDPQVADVVAQINRLGSEAEFGAFLRSNRFQSYEAEYYSSGEASGNQYNQFGNYGQPYGYGQGQYNPYNQQVQSNMYNSYGYGQQGQFVNNPNNQQNSPYGLNPSSGYGQPGGPYANNGIQLQMPCLGISGFSGYSSY